MQVRVNGKEYTIGGYNSGPQGYTEIRFYTTIDNEIVFLDDFVAYKYHGEGNHPIYDNQQKEELLADVKERLAKNIQKVLDARAGDRRS